MTLLGRGGVGGNGGLWGKHPLSSCNNTSFLSLPTRTQSITNRKHRSGTGGYKPSVNLIINSLRVLHF